VSLDFVIRSLLPGELDTSSTKENSQSPLKKGTMESSNAPFVLSFFGLIIQRSGSGVCGFYISDNRCLDRSAWKRLASRSEPWIGRKTIMDEMILNNCPISTQGNQDEIIDSQCIRRELKPWNVRELISYSEGHRLWCRRDWQKGHSHVFIERCSSDWFFVTIKPLIQ
jgi:hypothetical protein